MNDFLSVSAYAGITISLLAYLFGNFLKTKLKLTIFNPLLVSIIVTILVLIVFNIDYEIYNKSANILSWLLTPATVCLAVPLYEQFSLLKKNYKAVLIGIVSGVFTSLITVLAISFMMGLDHTSYVTLLPKSITTAIGIGVSEELGGYVNITAVVIILTGVFGNLMAESLCKILKINEPISKGLAIGSASHAIGTVKAMELGPIEGAMSSLSIVVAGILTVILAPIFSGFL